MGGDNFSELSSTIIYFVARRPAPEAEADRPHAHRWLDAHSLKHWREFNPPAEYTPIRSRGRDSIETRQYFRAIRPTKDTLSVFGRRYVGCPVEETDLIAAALLQTHSRSNHASSARDP